MNHVDSSAFFFGWEWILWMGFIFLLFSSFGNWGYSYSAHRKFDGASHRDAASIMNERYAAGELTRAQYLELKADIAAI